MPRRLTLTALVCLAQLVLFGTLEAADPAPAGTVWVGVGQRFGPPDREGRRIISSDVELKIVARDGESFKGEFAIVKGTRRLVLEGTITPNGGVKAKPTKVLKGEWPSDIVGRAQLTGSVKGERMKLRFGIPQGTRFGDLELKLKKPEGKEKTTAR